MLGNAPCTLLSASLATSQHSPRATGCRLLTAPSANANMPGPNRSLAAYSRWPSHGLGIGQYRASFVTPRAPVGSSRPEASSRADQERCHHATEASPKSAKPVSDFASPSWDQDIVRRRSVRVVRGGGVGEGEANQADG